ncbi:glycosyltransferase family 2 protein [Piedraia hortae CBS 480.64]|uniref:chitin synthase n=1 Tax=Piedraia hortae CBS 480.64 TaxID=1314780 RepID=A0A6A7C7D1_9PEZI|nr:glycosyltransferase family 2 protein [Piedraia hortae CBS 480.64]
MPSTPRRHQPESPRRPRRPSHGGTRTEKPRRRASTDRSTPRAQPRSSSVGGPRSPPRSRQRAHHGDHREPDEYREEYRRRRRSSGGNRPPPRPTYDSPRMTDHRRYLTQSEIPSPVISSPVRVRESDAMLEHGTPVRSKPGGLNHKKSLVRPERRREDPDGDPNYHYSQHAKRMNILPSTTGRDPQLEDDMRTLLSDVDDDRLGSSPVSTGKMTGGGVVVNRRGGTRRTHNTLSRKPTKEERAKMKKKIQNKEAEGKLSLWNTYCRLVTLWCPNIFLKCAGMRQKEQQRAWREKMGLISIILLIMLFVGFLTFGFTETVCPAGGPARLRVNEVSSSYMIVHGRAYDLSKSRHPLARGIRANANVLYDLQEPQGGKDGSFLFQNVNGACKGLIRPAPKSDVPHNSNGDMAWYFPCTTFNQDGSSEPNKTIPYYLGYACHTSKRGRDAFYDLRNSGDVFFTWDDVRNTSRNLVVYSGDVLDLDLLAWFNTSQVSYPSQFDRMRTNLAIRGKDITLAFSSGSNRQMVRCLQEIVKVGSVDTLTVGCIASKVVLYVSLIFILGIVAIKFLLALLFQWFLCRKFAADKTSMSSNKKERMQQIEDWTNDIYRPAPDVTDPVSEAGMSGGNRSKRNSFLPTTSRFTSPYAMDRPVVKDRPLPTTMASQQSTARLLPGSTNLEPPSNRSEVTLSQESGSRASLTDRTYTATATGTGMFPNSETTFADTNITGPQGFIHESVVPQPPVEWQPFGYPLAHTICLITAYSEGPEGIRTTLDSIAMTDYPNSHKLILVICDGLIKGKGESMSTPEVCLSMMTDHVVPPDEVQPFSYVAVASGSKRHNMAKVYSGFYDYGRRSIIPPNKQQRVPMVLIVKCGTPAESKAAKPGNRGKRDSQIILMSFLQKVMFDERMTQLEYEMFNGIWKVTGISPDFYEIVLMVDADTKVFPDSLTNMISAMVKDPEVMGLCGETKIANKTQSWVSMIQVFEYFISHHQSKSFESVFGGVTCLPGCFCMYRIKTPKGGQNYWVPVLANPDIVEHYSENVVNTLHTKNLLLLGEDRYLSTLMLKTFPKRKQIFVPQAVCKTTVPDSFKVLLSQRRRWINSTVHNLMELVLVRDLCGTFCFSMQFVVFIELVGTLVLPAAIAFTIFLIIKAIIAAATHSVVPVIPLILLALILGLPAVLIVVTAHRPVYVLWMLVYLLSLPIWNFVLPVYAYWHFDDFSWGDTRQTAGEVRGADKGGHGGDGEFDSSQITMKRWADFERESRFNARGREFDAKGGNMFDAKEGVGYGQEEEF